MKQVILNKNITHYKGNFLGTVQIGFPLYFTISIALLIIASYYFIPEASSFAHHSFEVLTSNNKMEIQTWINSFGLYGPLLLIIISVLQIFLLMVPTILLLIICIFAYGPIWGSLIALLMVYFASSVGYWLGVYCGSTAVTKLLGRQAEKFTEVLEKYGFWAILLTRLNPFSPNDTVSVISGTVKIPYPKFIFASLTGTTPLILCIAIFGESRHGLLILLYLSLLLLIIFLGYLLFKRRNDILKWFEWKSKDIEEVKK